MLKVMTVFGTRPEAIKMAPVVKAIEAAPDMESVVTVTAQHREMLDQVLDLFDIAPDYDLNIMCAGQTLFDITTRAVGGLKDVMESARPDVVLVHGDTTTTFAGALAAFYKEIPVCHVEAGLRTGNRYSPFPEEMNRKLTGALATVHFAPTASAEANLLKENVPSESVFVTGNTVIDALSATVRASYVFSEEPLASLDFSGRRIVLVTTHRRENLGEPMRQVYRALRRLTETFDDIEVVFPVHKNPQVRAIVSSELGNLERVHLIDPLDYEPFANLTARSYLVMTDSGGIQEEAPSLGKPVLVLRDTTERPEAVEAGTVRLVGTEETEVYDAAHRLLSDRQAYAVMAEAVNPYGDGEASRRIAEAIRYRFLNGERAPDRFDGARR